jgi:hypothetical protein
MLSEMIKAIVGLADERQNFRAYREPDGKYEIVVGPDGIAKRLPVPNYRDYRADNLAAFVTLLGNAKPEDDIPVVFVSADAEGVNAECFFRESDRKDAMTLTVEYSEMLKTFIRLKAWHKQKDVMSALRDQLFSSAEPTLLPLIRNLVFKRRSESSGSLHHGKDMMGKSVEESVSTKNGEAPDRTTFAIPLFSASDFRAHAPRIECTVDYDATNETVRFVPVNDELTVAINSGTQHIANKIREALDEEGIDSLVVLGSPR